MTPIDPPRSSPAAAVVTSGTGNPQRDGRRTQRRGRAATYRQLGNSVAVPVFEWVFSRLVAVDQRSQECAA